MRLVQVSIPAGKKEAVLSVLDEEGIDYVVTDETGGHRYVAVVCFPLPINAVEPILDDLRDVGLDKTTYTVTVEAETVSSPQFESLKERYQAEEHERGTAETRIAGEELRTRCEELAPTMSTYLILTVVSTIVATAGLLIDSPATVVGSMVIAPLVGPAMAASAGTVINDRELFLRGAKLQVIGLALAVVSATAFAFFAKQLFLVPPTLDVTAVGEVEERLTPGVLTLLVAVGAGFAGAVSLSAGVSTAIVGVMIAVALIPPAAVVGIGIAWGLPFVSLGAAVLTLVNVLSINLAAITLLWYRGYAPQNTLLRHTARRTTIKRAAVLVAVIAVLSMVLGGVTYDSYKKAQTKQEIEQNVQGIVDRHGSIMLLSTDVKHERGSYFRPPDRVNVVVGVTPDTDPPSIAETIKGRVDNLTHGDITVRVRYVTVERTT